MKRKQCPVTSPRTYTFPFLTEYLNVTKEVNFLSAPHEHFFFPDWSVSALYSQVARTPHATLPCLWERAYSLSALVNLHRQSLLLLLCPRPCVKDTSQHGETSLYTLLQPLPLHLAGADPCQVCGCAFKELSIMGKSRETGSYGFKSHSHTGSRWAQPSRWGTWGSPTKAPDVSPEPSHFPAHMPGL